MATEFKNIGGALLAMCLVLFSHMSQAAIAIDVGTAYAADNLHTQHLRQFDNDVAKTSAAQVNFKIQQTLYPGNTVGATLDLKGMRVPCHIPAFERNPNLIGASPMTIHVANCPKRLPGQGRSDENRVSRVAASWER